jgi:hypothetical protein
VRCGGSRKPFAASRNASFRTLGAIRPDLRRRPIRSGTLAVDRIKNRLGRRTSNERGLRRQLSIAVGRETARLALAVRGMPLCWLPIC